MIIRRAFLGLGLMLVGLQRRGWAQLGPIRYAPLSRPVSIPTERVAIPWRPVAFTAEAMAPAAGSAAGRRVLIHGVLFRKAIDDARSQFNALCVTCPHEQCQVDLVSDPAQLLAITGRAGHHPVFECGCHASVFDAREDGARIAGEAARGLYRFRIGSVNDATVEITDVEADALSEV
jgi:Rieske Fe-S protein